MHNDISKSLGRFVLILGFCFVLLIEASHSQIATKSGPEKTTALVFASDEWCPFYCPRDPARPGFFVELLKSAIEGTPYSVEFKTLVWGRSIEQANNNVINGIVGCYRSDAPDFVFPSVTPAQSKDCFYGKKEQGWTYTGPESLKGKRVGIITSYGYGELLDEFKDSTEGKRIFFSVSGDEPLEQNLRKLTAGRLDLVLENTATMEFARKKNPQLSGLESKGCESPKGVYFALGPKNPMTPKLIKHFNSYLESKKGKALIRALQKKYDLE